MLNPYQYDTIIYTVHTVIGPPICHTSARYDCIIRLPSATSLFNQAQYSFCSGCDQNQPKSIQVPPTSSAVSSVLSAAELPLVAAADGETAEEAADLPPVAYDDLAGLILLATTSVSVSASADVSIRSVPSPAPPVCVGRDFRCYTLRG